MLSVLDKVIHDFEDEVDALKYEQFPCLRSMLKKFLRSLKTLDDLLLDGYEAGLVLKIELKGILTEAETEIGALLLTSQKHKITPDHHQRIADILQRLTAFKRELQPSASIPRTGSFRIPLFTRSDSFKSVNYEIPSERPDLRCVSLKIEREHVKTTVKYVRPPPSKLHRCSMPSRPPPPAPPAPPSKDRSQPRKKSEITRLPMVVKLFHSFRARVTESTVSKKKLSIPQPQQSNPSAVIEELLSRSTHAQKINQEVEVHNETIRGWANEIKAAKFSSMDEVVSFVDRMDKSMSETLTDEVVILKRVGDWPKRYDVLREASASWKQLKELEATLLKWRINEKGDVERELKRTQDYFDKLDPKLQSMMRHQTQEGVTYTENGIPWTQQVFDCVKAAALVPIELYLKAFHSYVSKLYSAERRRLLFSKCALFAFKGHQFVGGFNEACSAVFSQIEAAAHSVMPGIEQDSFKLAAVAPS